MTTPGELIDVTPEELNAVLDRIQEEQITELAIVGPIVTWLSLDPNEWPETLRGKRVHRLRDVRPDVAPISRLSQLRDLLLSSVDLGEDGARVIAERLTNLTSLNV